MDHFFPSHRFIFTPLIHFSTSGYYFSTPQIISPSHRSFLHSTDSFIHSMELFLYPTEFISLCHGIISPPHRSFFHPMDSFSPHGILSLPHGFISPHHGIIFTSHRIVSPFHRKIPLIFFLHPMELFFHLMELFIHSQNFCWDHQIPAGIPEFLLGSRIPVGISEFLLGIPKFLLGTPLTPAAQHKSLPPKSNPTSKHIKVSTSHFCPKSLIPNPGPAGFWWG